MPAVRGGYIDIERFRHREVGRRPCEPLGSAIAGSTTAVTRSPHGLSRTAVPLWRSPSSDTSAAQLEDTYARWLKRTDDQLRAAFDSYDLRAAGGAR